ncbi:MAG: phosphoribosylanthranilate isomerase, partial [Anaerolineae bacterium]|nr:phosphoribosylanthranilate isomerase [Anaerolineae bacterium]
MTTIKICGLTTLEDTLIAAAAGADLLGFNFFPPSPRYVRPEHCRAFTDELRDRLGNECPLLVGVFVNEPDAAAILEVAGLDYAQLHGDETVATLEALEGRAFKAIR